MGFELTPRPPRKKSGAWMAVLVAAGVIGAFAWYWLAR
jgi:hypothetical protein